MVSRWWWAAHRDPSSVPDFEEAVPGSRCYSHAVLRHTQAAHSVVMASKYTSSLSLHGVPDIAVEVVVAG